MLFIYKSLISINYIWFGDYKLTYISNIFEFKQLGLIS